MESNIQIKALLARGDDISVVDGLLRIIPKSGRPVPVEWIAKNLESFGSQIAALSSIDIFTYGSYTTGKYAIGKYPGLTMQFDSVTDPMKSPYAIFNVKLDRDRTTKHGVKGSPLPGRQFRVGRKRNFYKFWKRAGLPDPRRMSAFHEEMGKLNGILFTGGFRKGDRLQNDTIRPVQLSCQTLRYLCDLESDNVQTPARQVADNSPTIIPDKRPPQNKPQCDSQPSLPTGGSNHKTSHEGNAATRDATTPTSYGKVSVKDQTIEQWLKSHNSAA